MAVELLATCKRGEHQLEEIYRDESEYEGDAVVRWCTDCGSIVVDEEYDGRVRPGSIIPMKSPRVTKEMNNG